MYLIAICTLLIFLTLFFGKVNQKTLIDPNGEARQVTTGRVLLAFALIIFTIVRKVVFGDPTSGWPSLVCIISLISGVQLFCLGIVGQYLAKTYMEVKNRPIYLVKEEI